MYRTVNKMNPRIALTLCFIASLSIAAFASSAILTSSDASNSDVSLKDLNSDGLVDVVDSEEGIFWNQGDNQFYSNEMILADREMTNNGFGSYHPHQDPINATSLSFKPSYFVYNHIHIGEEKASIMDLNNFNTTFYERRGDGTYYPTRSVHPIGDFNQFLHIIPIMEYQKIED
jgi:hypothetical protein